MIFLRDNVLIERDLKLEDVKPRLLGWCILAAWILMRTLTLLGHWGTCPGLILVWSHLSFLVKKHEMEMIFVVGPGHGAPAVLAALWLEGSLQKFYPGRYDVSSQGLHNLISGFSMPGGFPR